MYYEGWITSIVWQLNRDQKAVEMIIQLFSLISDASKANSNSKHGKGTTIWHQKGEKSRKYSDSKFDNKKYSDQADDNTEYSESRYLPYLILISIKKYSLIERLNKIDRFLHEKSSGSDKKPLTPPPFSCQMLHSNSRSHKCAAIKSGHKVYLWTTKTSIAFDSW